MPITKCKHKCKACDDQGDSDIKFLHFGTYTLSIKPWACRQTDSVYLVECNLCPRRTVYNGHSYMQVNTRLGLHYRNKKVKYSNKLDQHFLLSHPGIPMHTNVTVYIVSEEIPDKNKREGREQGIRRSIRKGERDAGIKETCLLNHNML